jgi:hypothetical protein
MDPEPDPIFQRVSDPDPTFKQFQITKLHDYHLLYGTVCQYRYLVSNHVIVCGMIIAGGGVAGVCPAANFLLLLLCWKCAHAPAHCTVTKNKNKKN